jgi:hypothetical protein
MTLRLKPDSLHMTIHGFPRQPENYANLFVSLSIRHQFDHFNFAGCQPTACLNSTKTLRGAPAQAAAGFTNFGTHEHGRPSPVGQLSRGNSIAAVQIPHA